MFDKITFSCELADCACNSKQSEPFFFQIKNQRVMLITACPSIQTVSSTLMSVRFVRQVLYALLGEEGVSDEGLSLLFAKKGIYWSHLHKCFNEKFYLRDRKTGRYILKELPSECAGKYLKHEFELLSNSLKLIIVMGNQTCRSAATYIDAFRNTQNASGKPIEIIEIDYLQDEIPAKYDELRKKVADALGRSVPNERADPIVLETVKTRMRVGLDTELMALEEFFATSEGNFAGLSLSPNKLDQLWIDRVVLPQKARQAELIVAWSTIESDLTAFFTDALDPRSRKAKEINSKEWLKDIIGQSRNGTYIISELDFRSLSAIIAKTSELWLMDKFINHLAFGHIPEKYRISRAERDCWQKISEDLKLFYQVRNILVHSSGFIASAELDRDETPFNIGYSQDNKNQGLDLRLKDGALSEIHVLTNTVYLFEEAPRQIFDLTKELVDFIIRLDEHLNK